MTAATSSDDRFDPGAHLDTHAHHDARWHPALQEVPR